MTSTNRLWVIGSVTIMIIVLVAGWFLGAQPFVDVATKADGERSGIEAQNVAQRAALGRLSEESKDMSAITAQYGTLKASIPASSDTAAFIQGLDGLAAGNSVQITGITVSQSQAYTVPASAAAPPTPSNGATPAPTPTPSPTSTAAPVATAPVGAVAATSPLVTPENFVGIKVGVDLKGSYENALSFVKGLQSGARLVLVTGITSTSSADNPGIVTAHVDGLIYVLKQAK